MRPRLGRERAEAKAHTHARSKTPLHRPFVTANLRLATCSSARGSQTSGRKWLKRLSHYFCQRTPRTPMPGENLSTRKKGSNDVPPTCPCSGRTHACGQHQETPGTSPCGLQGYLAHTKAPPPRTLP
ncbi:hypothetical protein T484DRAFT_1956877 [Baffinella frigidus]|nr:hypothetical protein T484DRAFT_1956877 [Cryptophyta sp. CCMP2293]